MTNEREALAIEAHYSAQGLYIFFYQIRNGMLNDLIKAYAQEVVVSPPMFFVYE